MPFNVKLYNVIILGLAFMLIFTAFQTMSIIETVVLASVHVDDPSFTGTGYTSLAIIYAVLAVANWCSPSVISLLGSKYTMVVGAITYSVFIASFLYPTTWALYASSVLVGLGAACIWTGQGAFLTANSDSETIGRNSGIFWAMLQCSLLFGNLYLYFQFQGVEKIDKDMRRVVFIVLLVIGSIGCVVMLFLRSVPRNESIESSGNAVKDALQALKKSFRLFLTRDMLLLSITFLYTGVELGFFSGVYGTSIGYTRRFDPIAKQMIGLSGIFIGVGEIVGGCAFGLMGKKTNRWGRDPIVLLGFIVHMTSFFLILINLPFDSPLGDTYKGAFIKPNEYLAIFCSFLLGFADSCFNTQLYSILGAMFPEDSAPAFALFKFIQSLGAAAAFVYSAHRITLEWHIIILLTLATLGTSCFCIVEWKVYAEYQHARALSGTGSL